MSTSKRRGPTLGITMMILALLLAACGGAGTAEEDPEGVASLGTDTTSPVGDESDSSNDEVEAPTDRNDAFLLYDQCMAEGGFPTDAAGQANDGPTVQQETAGGSDDQEGPTERIVGPGGIEIAPEDLEAFEAANQVCQAHLANLTQGAEFTPEQEAALEDANLRVRQCLDEKGIDAQISIGGGDGGGLIQDEDLDDNAPPPNQGEVDPEQLDAAMAECMAIFDEYPELADALPPLPGS
jgi:hypothetical protein